MNKPEQPWPPSKWEYNHEFTEEHIINIDMIAREYFDEAEYLEDWKDQHDWKGGDPLPKIEAFEYHNDMGSVADLLKKIPEGMPLDRVFISIDRDRMIDHVSFSVKYRKPTDKAALKNDYDKAYAEYEQKMAQYPKDLAAYNEWYAEEEIKKKQKEIRDLKDELAKLKK